MKDKIEKIITEFADTCPVTGKSEYTDKLIQLFNKHIEDKKKEIAEKVEEHDYESLSNDEVADNIINILKIKE